jgi:hypothetical protein
MANAMADIICTAKDGAIRVSTCSGMALILLACHTRAAATSGRVLRMALKRMSTSSSARVGVSLVSVMAATLFPVSGGKFSVVVKTASQREVTCCPPPAAIS